MSSTCASAVAGVQPAGDALDGPSEQRLREVDDVQHVHQDAAARGVRVVAPAGPIGGRSRVVRTPEPVQDGDLDRPDLIVVDELQRAHHLREEEVVVHDPEADSGRPRRFHDGARVRRRRRDRLLGEQVTSRPDRGEGQLPPDVLRCAQVDHVQVVAREHLQRVGMDLGFAQPCLVPAHLATLLSRVRQGDHAVEIRQVEERRQVVAAGRRSRGRRARPAGGGQQPRASLCPR